MSTEARFAIRDRDNLRHQNKRLQDRVLDLEAEVQAWKDNYDVTVKNMTQEYEELRSRLAVHQYRGQDA
jgi:predicted  nucleic acid-binding Zn-ribbon protein